MNALLHFHSKNFGASVERILLAKHDTHTVRLHTDEVALVRMTEGQSWITLEGDRHDYAAHLDQTLRFTGPGLLVIEGLHRTNVIELSTRHERALVA